MGTDSGSLFADVMGDVGIFRHLFDAMPQISWTATPDGSIDFYNKGWYEFTGTTFDQAKGWGWEVVHRPEHFSEFKDKFSAALVTGVSFEMEFPMRRHDGVFEWFLTRVNPLKDDDGQVVRWVGINSNIQALKDNQTLLEDRERRIATLANALPSFVWSTDRHLNVDFFNDRWYQYTGLTPEGSLGQGWRQCFSDEMLKKMDVDWSKAMETKTPYSGEQQIRSKDGEYRWFLTKGYPLLDDRGEIVSWFGTNTDIHEQKKASEILEKKVAERTRQLELEKDKAVLASQARTAFVATVGHEIRNPLYGVIGLLDLLVDSVESAESRELATGALSSSLSLQKILNDLLDSTKLEAGKLQIESVRFSLHEVISEVALLLRTSANRKALTFQAFVAQEIPMYVYGDELRFRQIVVNLVSNAIKFTDTGFVSVNCSQVSADEETVKILLEVKDSGIGIADENMQLLFQPYSQLDASTSRIYGGTGLGLSICQNLVGLMGGEIGVSSEVGVGSRFWVHLTFRTDCEPID